MTEPAEKGHRDAHTRADPPAADDQAVMPGADPDDLIAGSPDLEADDLLSMAAELVAAPRRERGRPAGALNRKNGDMVRYLQQLGHRDPWVTLSMIQTADTEKLAQKLSMKRGEVLALQLRAADAIMPYHHAKKPQQVELPLGDKRPLMVIGEMNVQIAAANGIMSAGMPVTGKVNEINGEFVRENAQSSHEDTK